MPYDDSFYVAYEEYLKEPRVRAEHDAVLQHWTEHAVPWIVIDLGCGRSTEYKRFGNYHRYHGFDVEAVAPNTVADYRDPSFLGVLKEQRIAPDAFVSLFSTEPTAPASDNQTLYESLFEACPTLTHALVAGFYYEGSEHIQPIGETGGIESYQTVGPWVGQSSVYRERRILAHVPSQMFGVAVVEVWRMLTRIES